MKAVDCDAPDHGAWSYCDACGSFTDEQWPIVDREQDDRGSYEADADANGGAGMTDAEVIERAGAALATRARRIYPRRLGVQAVWLAGYLESSGVGWAAAYGWRCNARTAGAKAAERDRALLRAPIVAMTAMAAVLDDGEAAMKRECEVQAARLRAASPLRHIAGAALGDRKPVAQSDVDGLALFDAARSPVML